MWLHVCVCVCIWYLCVCKCAVRACLSACERTCQHACVLNVDACVSGDIKQTQLPVNSLQFSQCNFQSNKSVASALNFDQETTFYCYSPFWHVLLERLPTHVGSSLYLALVMQICDEKDTKPPNILMSGLSPGLASLLFLFFSFPLSKRGKRGKRDCHWEGVMADRKREASDLSGRNQGVLASFFISQPKWLCFSVNLSFPLTLLA